MKYYSLAHSGMFANLSVAAFESEGAASARATSLVAVDVVSTVDDLKAFGGPALVALYNALREDGSEPVSRFATKGDAARRCFAALEARHQNQAAGAAAPSTVDEASAAEPNDGAEVMKSKKAKVAKAPKPKKEPKAHAPKVKKEHKGYSAKVKSSGGAESKGKALELVSRAKGATPEKIAEKLGCSVGTAKNLIWYLRRDGKKIVLGEKAGDRRPYVIG